MKIHTPTFMSAEDVLTELQKITLNLEAMELSRNESDTGSVVWASQATLAKRDDSPSLTCAASSSAAFPLKKPQLPAERRRPQI